MSAFHRRAGALLDAGLGMVDTLRTLSQKERDSSGRQAWSGHARRDRRLAASRRSPIEDTFLRCWWRRFRPAKQTGDRCPRCDASARTGSMRMLRGKLSGRVYPALCCKWGRWS